MRHFIAVLLSCVATMAQAATINVTTLVDENDNNGQCSLREAVIAANNALVPPAGCVAGTGATIDKIIVPAGTYALTIVGSGENGSATGDLDISDSVVIEGASAETTIIDAGGTLGDRVVELVANNLTVTLRGLTITGGRAPSSGSTFGGGIFNSFANTALIVDRCIVRDNVAGSGVGSGGNGGGIYNGSNKLLIVDSQVRANTAGSATCSVGGGQAGQGAGASLNGGLVLRSVFEGNISGTTTGCSPGLRTMGVAVQNASSPLTIEDSHFQDNGQGHDGGAINAYQGLIVRRSSFVGNSALRGGSAIYALFGTNLVENSTFSGNVCAQNGGTVQYSSGTEMRVSHSTIVGNTGGGVHQINAGTFTLRSSLVADNVTTSALPSDCAGNTAVPTTAGYNLFGLGGGCAGDFVQFDGTLSGALGGVVGPTLSTAANGTKFHPPSPQSAVIDRGACTNASGVVIAVDQRGLPRACGCDVGAIDVQRSPIVISDEGAGINCAAGGKRIDTVDCSGAVLQTSYVCAPILTTGPTGPTGADGASGAVGATGGEGATGAQGATGAEGATGAMGAEGATGASGTNGAMGAMGAEGATGASGANGVNGTNGTNGVAGAEGQPGATGPTGPRGEPGTWVHTEKLAAGDATCPNGGLLLRVGLDEDGDGQLTNAETLETHAVCTPDAPARGCASTTSGWPGVLLLLGVLRLRRKTRAGFLG